MKRILALALACVLALEAPLAFADATVNVGKTVNGGNANVTVPSVCYQSGPMGPGGGRSTDPAMTPLAQKASGMYRQQQIAKQASDAILNAGNTNMENVTKWLDNCLIKLDGIFDGFDYMAILQAIMNALLTEACNYIKNMAMGQVNQALSHMNKLQTELPYIGNVGVNDVFKVNVSSGGTGLSWKVNQPTSDTTPAATGTTAKYANEILSNLKANTFKERLANGK